MIENVRIRLEQLSEEDYKKFNENLLPGTKHVLGVRMPKAARAGKRKSADKGSYHEEIMLEGLVIAYAKMELKERFFYLDRFVPKIHNWAVCDCCCNTYKFMEKYQEESFAYLETYLHSQREYELRFELCPFWIILSMILILTGCFLYANIQDMKDIM